MNNITTIMNKETITQDIRGSPQCGATSTNSSSSLLSSVNLLTCTEHQTQLCIGQEICTHLTRSSFPELDHNTNPSYTVCTQASYNHLHLALQVLTHIMHKTFRSTKLIILGLSSFLHFLASYLYITKWA
jgi:hypothetical protein